MPIAIATAITLAASAAGAALTYSASQDQAKAVKNISRESQQQEAVRKQQMLLETQRRQREVIRNMQIARGKSANAAAGQGALSSSAFQGGQASIVGQAVNQVEDIRQNRDLASQIFDSNANIAGYRADAAGAEAEGQLGKTLFQLGPQLGKLGETVINSSYDNGWSKGTTATRSR